MASPIIPQLRADCECGLPRETSEVLKRLGGSHVRICLEQLSAPLYCGCSRIGFSLACSGACAVIRKALSMARSR